MTTEDWVFFAPMVGAVVLVVLAALSAGSLTSPRLSERMGPVNYDFSKSWASSITVVGALLGTVLSAKGVVPTVTKFLPAATYSALNLAFGILVVLAPFLYRSVSAPVAVTTAQGPDTEYQGTVAGFLLATALTLWGVLGELTALCLLFAELQESQGVSLAFLGLFTLSGVLLIIYSLRSIPAVIRAQAQHPARAAALQVGIAAAGMPVPDNAATPRQNWSLL